VIEGRRLPTPPPPPPATADVEGPATAGGAAISRPARARYRRGMLPYYGYRVAETLVRVTPPRVVRALGAATADTLLTLRPRSFDGLRSNLQHVLPDADRRQLRRVMRANIRNLIRSWIEVMEMPYRADSLSRSVQPVNIEYMLQPLERGRGVVVVSLHLGSWEVGLAGYNHRLGRMALLAEVLQPAQLFERVVAARARMGVQVIPIDIGAMRGGDEATARRLGAAALRDVWRVLRNNGLVAMAIDRDMLGTGEPIEFFGEPARIPTGVVEIAIRSGAALVPIVLLRVGSQVVGRCYPEVTYDPDADRDTEVRRVTRACLEVLEGVIREYPEQWHVLDPVWPSLAP